MSLEIKQEPFTLELYAIAIHYAMLSGIGTRAPAFVLLVSALATAKLLEHAGYSWVWKTKFVQHCHAQFCEMNYIGYLRLPCDAYVCYFLFPCSTLTQTIFYINQMLLCSYLPPKEYANPQEGIDICEFHRYPPWVQKRIRESLEQLATPAMLLIGNDLYRRKHRYPRPLAFWRDVFEKRLEDAATKKDRDEWDVLVQRENPIRRYTVAELLGN